MDKKIVLKIDDLRKVYDGIKAVDGISFTVKEGEIVGLLGPNGAGKTTTINMILGILEPSGGKIEILGKDMSHHACAISEQMNFAAVYAHPPANLTVRQNLKIFGLLYGVKNLNARVEALLQEFDLVNFADSKSGLLSSGELSRLNLAKAIINEPRLLLLDEPTASLDPSISEIIREKIKVYVKKTQGAILWTSHNMAEIEAVCNQVMFLSHGKILLTGDPKQLPAQHGKKNLEELFITVAREPLTIKEYL